MRRGLAPADLGDLFDLPLAAIVSLTKADGTVFSRPVWHRWEAGRFVLQFPHGDRKIPMLERDNRLTVLLAENAFPYRGIEVRGHGVVSPGDYRSRAMAINARFVAAYDPETPLESYVSNEPGVIVDVVPDVVHCWDYADDALMP